MLTYSPVSEAGGVAKTTTAANLAVAHAQEGFDVLCIDLDAQNGSLSFLFDVDYDPSSPGDNIVRHLIDRPKGAFSDLIHTVEAGVDIVPSPNMLEDLEDYLTTERDQAEKIGDTFDMYHQLLRVLRENNVRDEYDILIVDSAGKPGPILYNALVATQNVVVTFEASEKGQQSIEGLDELVGGMEAQLDVGVSVLAILPVAVKQPLTIAQRTALEAVEGLGFDVPVRIPDRTAMCQDAWRYQCSLFSLAEHRDVRDYEAETLEQYRELARHLEAKGSLTRPAEVA